MTNYEAYIVNYITAFNGDTSPNMKINTDNCSASGLLIMAMAIRDIKNWTLLSNDEFTTEFNRLKG